MGLSRRGENGREGVKAGRRNLSLESNGEMNGLWARPVLRLEPGTLAPSTVLFPASPHPLGQLAQERIRPQSVPRHHRLCLGPRQVPSVCPCPRGFSVFPPSSVTLTLHPTRHQELRYLAGPLGPSTHPATGKRILARGSEKAVVVELRVTRQLMTIARGSRDPQCWLCP